MSEPGSSPSNRIALPLIEVGEKKKKEKPAKHNDVPQKGGVGFDDKGDYTKEKKTEPVTIVTRRVPKDMQNKKEYANRLADELAAQYGKKVKVRLEVIDDEGGGGGGGGGSKTDSQLNQQANAATAGAPPNATRGYDATFPPQSSLNPSQSARATATAFETLQRLSGLSGTQGPGSITNGLNGNTGGAGTGSGGTGGGTGSGTGSGAGSGKGYGGNLNETGTASGGKSASESYLGRAMSDSEYSDLTKATHAEAGQRNQLEVAMITASILNRARINGQTIREVLTAPKQFESVTGRRGVGFNPSQNFVRGPGDARAAQIYGGMEKLLPLISQNQTDFTSANPYAYGGFDRGSRIIQQRINKGFVQVGDSLFNTNPPDISQFNQ